MEIPSYYKLSFDQLVYKFTKFSNKRGRGLTPRTLPPTSMILVVKHMIAFLHAHWVPCAMHVTFPIIFHHDLYCASPKPTQLASWAGIHVSLGENLSQKPFAFLPLPFDG